MCDRETVNYKPIFAPPNGSTNLFSGFKSRPEPRSPSNWQPAASKIRVPVCHFKHLFRCARRLQHLPVLEQRTRQHQPDR